jgi:hypothetical protein
MLHIFDMSSARQDHAVGFLDTTSRSHRGIEMDAARCNLGQSDLKANASEKTGE